VLNMCVGKHDVPLTQMPLRHCTPQPRSVWAQRSPLG
jgi:hypothetical protein